MGAIICQEEHAKDVAEMRTIAAQIPVVSRFISHHARNPLQSILGYAELAQKQLTDKEYEALMNTLHKIMLEVDHLSNDLREVGL